MPKSTDDSVEVSLEDTGEEESTQRVVMCIGYLGDAFHGSQLQPKVRTSQGDVESILRKLKWLGPEDHIWLSSRTDAGVHVRMNLASFDLPLSRWDSIGAGSLLRAINDRLEDDIIVWSAYAVSDDVTVRLARRRVYLYRLQALPNWPADMSPERLARWCRVFEGGHDFTNFCRVEEGRTTVRTVHRCAPWVDVNGRVVGFRIEAESFLWNQVRRIASALHGLATENLDLSDVIRALHRPSDSIDFGRSPSDWLMLWSIQHPALPDLDTMPLESISEWSNPPGGTNQRLHERWQEIARKEMKLMLQRGWIQGMESQSDEID
ncbi:MAG TPA: hypothetical protein HA330_06245 [Candidatus Thalassarchaeaceae archaeon]|nr:MAG TPA: hypothetical protein D7H85_06240 [Candidatus Poseidoniales archaeon]HII49473.1 hypothetical protein [Candidatus Thalassarchaeaceae archaeon]|tara:strand:- start:2196 stop:3158 length:963 start_codon:yes stop_codon:yes gene_type:complete